MQEKENIEKSFFIRCAIVQSVTVAIILLSVLIIGFISKSGKRAIKKWYINNVLEDTSIQEVLGEDKNAV